MVLVLCLILQRYIYAGMRTEINRLLCSFADLQHGDCGVGTSFRETLQGVTAEVACKKLAGGKKNIWELVSHIIYWRTSVINKLSGTLNPPPFHDFKLPEVQDDNTWRKVLQDFESTYHLLRNAVSDFSDEKLNKLPQNGGQTYYQIIIGCLQHDAYHLGQLALLRKYLTSPVK